MEKEVALPPQYEPKEVENRLYAEWVNQGVFTPKGDGKKKPYVIIQPPPNVTGVLHMGHALTSTLEDILTRRKRMQGFDTLWLPGTDHAGIATQMVVERQILKDEGKTKHDLGRDEFLRRVWAWKEQCEGTILSQQRKIGAGLDWTRLHFTLDEGPARAVRECFVRLYRDGLVTRSTAMIQWCPRCRTALSDLEVKSEERQGTLWHIRYPLAGDASKWLVVATTRPETLLGDVAVAVHPEDERYRAFHGKKVRLPLLDREIPVIADAYVDRAFGTGALKITPAHDPNDYEIGKRHELSLIDVFDERAHLTEAAGPYKGLSREKAREKVLEDLKARGQLEKEQSHPHAVGHCDRCKTIVEPKVSRQWFVDAATLAKPAIEAVEKGHIKIVPQEWEKTYFEWMRNIRPWCVSRQLWWGHRIPVWYCECGEELAALEAPERCPKCDGTKLRQDEDVLDTWFSSGLWPFSTLGWPDETADLKRYYPTDVLETGFDILFFWVARMIMLGIRMTGKIPFHTVYLHPMVRDEHGQKMSKTKGNVIDPLEIIDRMGADSLRMYFALNTFHGRDMRVSDAAVEGSRNFVNKLWNAARFVLMHFSGVTRSHVDRDNEINRWIWASLNETKREVNRALDEYRFFEAANRLYHFVWDVYCSWFVELVKSPEELERRKRAGESTAVEVLEETLRLLHPIMPFVTEEIWRSLPLKSEAPSIALAPYPTERPADADEKAKARLDRICALIAGIRTQRGMANVSPATSIRVLLHGPEPVLREIAPFEALVERLAKVSALEFTKEEPDRKAHLLHPLGEGLQVFIPRDELGDTEAELQKMKEEMKTIKEAIHRAKEKLRNQAFLDKAPENVIKGVERQRRELEEKLAAIERYLKDNAR